MKEKQNTLWTRDFTIITVGSFISLMGSTLSGFAMSLMVLDYTGSTLLFAVYNILYLAPSALAPILAGPFLDRFSRKKTIYTLDFLTAGLFAVIAAVLAAGKFSFAVLAGANFLIGAIGGTYSVAYQSFYPLTITEGNFQRAYAIDATLETLSAFMVPISTLVYNSIGIVPLCLVNALTYLAAAIMETQIKTEEKYTERDTGGQKGIKMFLSDFKEGLGYLSGEKGLLAIALYFTVSSLVGGVTGVVTLPYFKSAFDNGEYIFMLVWGMGSVSRVIAGAIHYKTKLPTHLKYAIALVVYITTSLLEGFYLYLPIPVMMVFTFASGLLGMTSYNIRISATQRYVPDEKKGRFNGVFGTLNTVGALAGEAAAGVLSLWVSDRAIVTVFELICLAAAIVFIGGGRREVEKIYNTEDAPAVE